MYQRQTLGCVDENICMYALPLYLTPEVVIILYS